MALTRIHLDTDLGGDSDDLCALALLLGEADVELTGITTSADTRGGRAAMVRHALALAGRADVDVASGAFAFLSPMREEPGLEDERYWPGLEPRAPTAAAAAFELLEGSLAEGATIVAIGPLTNFALFEVLRPGVLGAANVIVMGGHVAPPERGYPQWGPDLDYNIHSDAVAARIVFERVDPLIVPLGITLHVSLRASHLPALEAGGPLARLIARQGMLHGADYHMADLAPRYPAIPADILNFQYDPLACAAALGWDCVTVEERPLALIETDGWLHFEERAGAPLRRVVTAVDAAAFESRWVETVVRV